MKKITVICTLLLNTVFPLLLCDDRFPAHYTPQRLYTGQRIDDIIFVSEQHIDVGLWALIIANEYDSTVHVESYLQRLDEAAEEIRRMLAGRTSDFDKLLAIRTYIYEAGRWNNFQPYSYDLNDPFGENIHNKLLSTFMDNRKGNCISMPLLFIALAERIDPDLQIRGVLAPRHLTCRFRDRQTDDVMLIEPTNGGFPARNQHYIDNYGITQKAIQSGLYLRDLTRRELISDIMHVLVKHANKELNNHNRALEYAGIQLMLFPDGLCGYFSWAASLEWECQTTGLFAKLKHREPLTMEEKELATRYRQQVQMLDSLAEAKGWKPESEEQRATYLKEIEAEKQKRKSSQKTTSRVTSTKR